MNKPLMDFTRNVRVVKANELDQRSFDEFVPLIIKDALTRASKKWMDTWLLQHFGIGRLRISSDSRPAMIPFTKYVALGEYLDTLAKSKTSAPPTEYLFHTWMEHDFEEAACLLEDLDVPTVILDLGRLEQWRFFVGPALSGTLPHNHSAAINALARGQKRWAIYVGADPHETSKLLEEGYRKYGSGSQAKDWFAQECPKLRSRRRIQLWEFVQEAGDLVYIPAGFIHAVVNLEPVVGFGAELRGLARGSVRTRRHLGARPRSS